MTNPTTGLQPQAVRPRYEDLPPFAYVLTDDNLADAAAMLSLNLLHRDGRDTLEIPFERRYNLASAAHAGDVIVRHPTTVRELEVLPLAKYTRAYAVVDATPPVDLSAAVRAEWPHATAWALIGMTPQGAVALPGDGIVDAGHLVGLAHIVAARVGGRS